MRLTEYVVSFPTDFVQGFLACEDFESLLSYAISYTRDEIATDYVIPAEYSAWVIGSMDDGEVEIAVTRLSHGAAFPTMKSGYCWEAPTIDLLDSDEADTVVYSPDGREGYAGRLEICGYDHNVWQCPDGRMRAQLVTVTGV